MKHSRIYSAIFLFASIVLFGGMACGYMLTIGLTVGVVKAVRGSEYWYQCWIGFDKFCNAILGGAHTETISSRLGKSIYYNRLPVFGLRSLDKIVAWMLDQIDTDHVRKNIEW